MHKFLCNHPKMGLNKFLKNVTDNFVKMFCFYS